VDELQECFVRWIDTRCTVHPRLAAGGSLLLRYFNYFLVENGVVASDRSDFAILLEARGLRNDMVSGVWLVMGISLREDAEAYGIGVSPAGEEARL
jgi:hypothetical protein